MTSTPSPYVAVADYALLNMNKKVIITGNKSHTSVQVSDNYARDEKIVVVEGFDLVASDGYHTFDELYDHRITIYIALCRFVQSNFDKMTEDDDEDRPVWRSQFHSDGSQYENWFTLGMFEKTGEQITYHIPMNRWGETDFAETLDKAPEWDEHTSQDVLDRIKKL